MNDPMDKHPEKMKSQMFLDVSPEKLEAMSPSELSEAMEAALDAMTEETYDPAVIDAYLDALDRKAPMPTHPNAESSYQDFQDKLQEYVEGASKPAKQTRKFRRIARTGIVAALLAVLLASAAQAPVLMWLAQSHGGRRTCSVLARSSPAMILPITPLKATRSQQMFQRSTRSLSQSFKNVGLRSIQSRPISQRVSKRIRLNCM